MRLVKTLTGIGTALGALSLHGAVWAQTGLKGLQGLERVGKPVSGGIGFQPAGTEMASDIHWLDSMVLIIITLVTVFVVVVLAWIVIRYNRRANPTPATFTHNSALEVTWTIVPIVILIVIGVFSLPVLYKQVEIPKADITLNVTGNQWYWSYEYPDEGVSFDAFMLDRSKLAKNGYMPDEYLLAADNAVVLPVNKTVVVHVTGSDVIHSWAVPSFGIRQDAVPGRLAEIWFRPDRVGLYFGQCSQLCGKNHAYMPITIKVVPQKVYDAWLAKNKEANAGGVKTLAVASN